MSRYLENITKFSFYALATIPLLKENLNSILIILCTILVVVNIFNHKVSNKPSLNDLFLTLVFWMFFVHELFSGDLYFTIVLRYLPFLIFPLIFLLKPSYINKKVSDISIGVFQYSVLLQSFIFLILFLSSNSINKLFYISPENIPYFREFVFENYIFQIHPTYFSSFLLISFTISLHNLLVNKSKIFIENALNIVVTAFFIFLFSSKMIILLMTLVFLGLVVFWIKGRGKRVYLLLIPGTLLLLSFIYPFRNLIFERFDEIRTEIDKPVKGTYYNSTNTRIAIWKCSKDLLNQVPLFGYGDSLQNELNKCYSRHYNSDFYKLNTYNTHNYYMNLILYGGWIFLLLFISYLFILYKKIKFSSLGLLLLFLMLIINLTENFFSRHYGIVLFSYFTSLIIYVRDTEPEKNLKQ